MFNRKMENGGNAILFLFIRLKHCNVTPGLKSATLLTTHLKVKPTLLSSRNIYSHALSVLSISKSCTRITA